MQYRAFGCRVHANRHQTGCVQASCFSAHSSSPRGPCMYAAHAAQVHVSMSALPMQYHATIHNIRMPKDLWHGTILCSMASSTLPPGTPQPAHPSSVSLARQPHLDACWCVGCSQCGGWAHHTRAGHSSVHGAVGNQVIRFRLRWSACLVPPVVGVAEKKQGGLGHNPATNAYACVIYCGMAPRLQVALLPPRAPQSRNHHQRPLRQRGQLQPAAEGAR